MNSLVVNEKASNAMQLKGNTVRDCISSNFFLSAQEIRGKCYFPMYTVAERTLSFMVSLLWFPSFQTVNVILGLTQWDSIFSLLLTICIQNKS
jgi:hypothetical protein